MEERNSRHKCLCCGKGIVEGNQLYDICSVCGWEDDPVQAQENLLMRLHPERS